jgi:hypothetical protein
LWDTAPFGPVKPTDIYKEHIASIFRIEEQAKQETSMKRAVWGIPPQRNNRRIVESRVFFGVRSQDNTSIVVLGTDVPANLQWNFTGLTPWS